ncbi:unnamed protein product [Adineta ricciae]|uniref:Uncharacterized protein n=1 Tax=Adineta ricciae TaxID=249248 RepID=A0A814NIR4_ADIRI|nr:unnamed protein product [Adineta ricciae]CAF1458909.1 unnamed protein product [Adineta ricciae]
MMWGVYLVVLNCLVPSIVAHVCLNTTQYSACSSNIACGCLILADGTNDGICSYLYTACSELNACALNNRMCLESDHTCVQHPRCGNKPLCFPTSMSTQAFCPPISSTTIDPSLPHDGICAQTKWKRDGIIVATDVDGSDSNEVRPSAIFVDESDAIYVADHANKRIVKWETGATKGQVVAGGHGDGNANDQFTDVRSIVVDKNGTMFICDRGNRRVQQWVKSANQASTVLDDILCFGLALDNEGSLYISDGAHDRVIKWPSNETVAGGHSVGFDLNQLNDPRQIFVDRHKSVYVVDGYNYRIVKWPSGAQEGIVVAGGNGEGVGKSQLSYPNGVVTDDSGTVYVLDYGNDRVTRWFPNAPSGILILGRPGFNDPDDTSVIYRSIDMTMDRHGNLYVVDIMNERILKFLIDKSACIQSN